MSDQASFALRGRNPDVLTCIANLSNDEVFTPPEFANRMLDTLAEAWAQRNNGANIWSDSSVRFLDPFTKSGIFLREIATRLTKGLAAEIPELQDRVDHILTKQVFGIATTRLTSLLARRSLYCSKYANGQHSVSTKFENESGNVWFERTEHTWVGEKCIFCGATAPSIDRGGEMETHAYAFIHTENIKARIAELFGDDMQFDVIIGNPPYQLSDASASASASPIYQKFIEQAMELEPRFLTMVTPSRWFVGGKGLDEFRTKMLSDRRLSKLVDFIVDKDAFPKINVNGGISYFLWDSGHSGPCQVTTVERGGAFGQPEERYIDEFDVFIRRNAAVTILRKVLAKNEESFSKRVSSRKPFGLPTNYFGAAKRSENQPIKLHSSGKITWVAKSELIAKQEWVDDWKVLVGRATDGNENYPLPIWDHRGPFVAGPGEACSETYLVASIAKDISEAENIVQYMRTIFFRFLVSLRKITQDNKSDIFRFVPDVGFDEPWTDEKLFSRYSLNENEIFFIREMIRDVKFTG